MTPEFPLSAGSDPPEEMASPPPWDLALMAALAGVLLVGILAWVLADRVGTLAQAWLRGLVVPVGGAGMAIVAFGRWNRHGLLERLELVLPKERRKEALGAGLVGGAGAFFAAIPLVFLSQGLFAPFLPETPPPGLTDLLAEHPERAIWFTVFIQALLLAPVAEEILFRLCMVETFRLYRLPLPGLLMALLFAVIHGRLDQVAGLCLLALWLYRLRCRYASLLPGILAHAVFNLLVLSAATWQLLKG